MYIKKQWRDVRVGETFILAGINAIRYIKTATMYYPALQVVYVEGDDS